MKFTKQIFNILNNRSNLWGNIRQKHLKKQSTCQACSSSKNLEVHHIIPVSVDSTKELDPTNLITLCKTCHFVFGHLMDYQSWNTQVIEDSSVYLNKILNKPYKIKGQNYDKNLIGFLFDFISKQWFFWYYRS